LTHPKIDLILARSGHSSQQLDSQIFELSFRPRFLEAVSRRNAQQYQHVGERAGGAAPRVLQQPRAIADNFLGKSGFKPDFLPQQI
jgi:hypothetical protein